MVADIRQDPFSGPCAGTVVRRRRSSGTAPASEPVCEVLPMPSRYSAKGSGGPFRALAHFRRRAFSADRLVSSHDRAGSAGRAVSTVRSRRVPPSAPAG